MCIRAGHGDPADFPSFISAVNRTIKPLGIELAKGYMEDTGAVWYGLVNRNSDTAAKIGSEYTPAELELFNRAVSDYVCVSECKYVYLNNYMCVQYDFLLGMTSHTQYHQPAIFFIPLNNFLDETLLCSWRCWCQVIAVLPPVLLCCVQFPHWNGS